jgi:hypothetical protein
MALQRFQTNKRLWLLFSMALFLVPWFIPFIQVGKGEQVDPFVFLTKTFLYSDEMLFFSAVTGLFVIAFGIAAGVIGWALQSVVLVIIRRKEDTRNTT